MKVAIAIALTLVATGAAAQQSGSSRRAPLANVDDLEPAVDVGATRVALISPGSGTDSSATRGSASTPGDAPDAGTNASYRTPRAARHGLARSGNHVNYRQCGIA